MLTQPSSYGPPTSSFYKQENTAQKMVQEYQKARNTGLPDLRTARSDLYRPVFLTTDNFQILKFPCLPWASCSLPHSSLFSFISFFFYPYPQADPTPSAAYPVCPKHEWGCTGLIPSGQGTGKAKCLPSPQAPAGKEGQAPQNRKAEALGGDQG